MTLPISERSAGNPLVLLYSPRRRIRDILTVGLTQHDYHIIQAELSYLATVKAYQFLPDLVIIDITAGHAKDVLLIPRLRRSGRTRHVSILVIAPRDLRGCIDALLAESGDSGISIPSDGIDILEYPFNFADLEKKVKNLALLFLHAPAGDAAGHSGDQRGKAGVSDQLFDYAIPAEKKLAMIEGMVHKQWVFPYTVLRALDIMDSDAGCCKELAKCISTDLSASASILKVANTVQYARRGKPISDITDAVVRLGFRETRNLLACLALIDLSPDIERKYGFSRQEFWLHSLATALISEKLCIDAGHRRPELGFIAGLVHDLGKIPLDNNCHPAFLRLLESAADHLTSFYDTEESMMGFSHCELAHYLTNKWNFPATISSAILNHHDAERIATVTTPIDRIVHQSVFAANCMAKAMNLGHSCDEAIQEIPPHFLQELRIPRGPSDRFFMDIFRNLRLLCQYLNIPIKNLMLGTLRPDFEKCEIVVVLGKTIGFHPIILALRNNGFNVSVVSAFSRESHENARAVLSISEKGCPIDIMLYEDETKEEKFSSLVRIFLLDSLPSPEWTKNFESDDIIFMDRHHLDFRLILHALDHALEKIVVPGEQKTEEGEENPNI
jgi:HD-like signal output (HDOD) protein